MAIAFGAAGTRLNQTTASTTFNVAYPAGITAGQLLVLFISSNGGAPSATPPSGWTEVYRETTVTNPKGGLYIKVATGSESGTLAVTMTSTTGSAQMFRYTGVDTTTPQDATRTSVSNTGTTVAHVILPSITTVTNGAMLVFCGSWNSGSRTSTAPAGSTERCDFIQDGGTAKAGSLADEIDATAGATGTRTLTSSSGTGIANWGAMMALRPAATDQIVNAPAATATAEAPVPAVSNGAVSLALDSSTLAVAGTQGTARTTASFTPPAGAILIACTIGSGSNQAGPTVNITNSGAGIGSWTAIGTANRTTAGGAASGVASMHWAPVNSSVATTVTATQTSGSAPTWLKVFVITNAAASPIGASTFGTSTANTLVTTGITTTAPNSWLLAVASEWTAPATAPTHIDLNIGQEIVNDQTGGLGGGMGAKLVPTSGTSATASIDSAGTAVREWMYVTAEILVLANTTGDVAAVTAAATAAAPAPGVSVGVPVAGIKATASAQALAPTLQAGATVTAVRATVAAAAPAPALQYGYTVQAVKATAASAGQAPTVGAGAAVTTPAATATAAALAPTVSAGGTAQVQAVPATATSAGIAPSVAAGANLAAIVAAASAAGLAPTVAYGATVVAIAATSAAAALAPNVGAGQTTTVAAVTATASAQAPAPVLHAFATLSPPAVAVSVQAVAPATSAAATITAPAATGTAAAQPAVITTLAGVQGIAAVVAAAAPAPVLAYGVTVAAATATATAASQAPQNVQGDRAVSLTAVRAVATGSAPAPGVQAYMAVFAVAPRATVSVATYAPSVGGQARVTAPSRNITVQARPVILMGVIRDLSLSASPLSATATVASLGTRIGAQPIQYTITSGQPLYGPLSTEPLYGRFRIEE